MDDPDDVVTVAEAMASEEWAKALAIARNVLAKGGIPREEILEALRRQKAREAGEDANPG